MSCLKIDVALLIICIMVLPACKPSDMGEHFLDAYESISIDIDKDLEEIRVVLIIPNAGCQGCISSLEQLVIDQKGELNSFLIIFTKYSSTKALRVRFTSEVVDGENVFLDSSNQFGRGELASIYPVIVYLENGKVRSTEHVSPDNPDALANLEHFLDTF